MTITPNSTREVMIAPAVCSPMSRQEKRISSIATGLLRNPAHEMTSWFREMSVIGTRLSIYDPAEGFTLEALRLREAAFVGRLPANCFSTPQQCPDSSSFTKQSMHVSLSKQR